MKACILRLVILFTVLVTGIQSAHAQQSAARIWNEQMLAAIRRNVPNPPAHARNLHHTAVAMYDAWAAYDATAVGYLYNEKVSPFPGNIEAARHEAISYAAYRVLRARFASGAGADVSLPSFDAKLTELGYSTVTAQAAVSNGTSPAELGKRIGQMILTWGAQDGFSQTAYPQAYDVTVNPNMDPAKSLGVLGNNGEFPSRQNMPLGVGLPEGTDPNFWQPLALSTSVTQNGIPTPGGIQSFVGVQSLATVPFSLTRSDPTKPWIDIGPPSRLSRPGQPSATDAAYKETFMDVVRKTAHLNDTNLVNISPGAIGDNSLGADDGDGLPLNPFTNQPYPANNVVHGDFARVLAEYWADGPNSETPPGHWHVLANQVSDNPLTVKKIKGVGPTVNNLEWDVKTYLSLSGAVHNAACAAWSLKRYYSGTRPITAIRYMCSKGQSSNPSDLNTYDPEGIPLETDLVEVITEASVGTEASPGKHYEIWDVYTNSYHMGIWHLGEIAVKGWPGEDMNNAPAPSIATHQSTVRWMLGKDWLPFQRKTFNTPAFPGYVSGHSTFSRSSAEVLALITGSPYFPGGFHHHTIAANSMQIDLGPSAAVDLQWATYYDAADQAGQSRRYGGIHPPEDDFPARIVGSQVGISAFNKAEKLWTGSIQNESIIPTVVLQGDGSVLITWNRVPGRFYKVQQSTNFTTWTDVNTPTFATTSIGSYTHTSPTVGSVYQIVETTPTIARVWNEQLLAAIRIDTPHPPKHARNLHHLATVMYDAWAAYDNTAIGYIHHERIASGGDLDLARKEAISYAAYRLLKARFTSGPGTVATNAALDAQMAAFNYNTSITSTVGTAPANLGNRIAATILAWGMTDGSGEADSYTDPTYFNPQPPMIVLGNSGAIGGIPEGTDPNRWQPLALSAAVAQNGVPIPETIQPYVGVTWLNTVPFSLSRTNPTDLWLDPGPFCKVSVPGTPSATDSVYKGAAMELLVKSSQLNSSQTINISPRVFGNNPLGADNGIGHPLNPVTGQPYADNIVKLGDFARVMAEFWADGPHSETPPGHWHVLANEVADTPGFQKRIGGVGPIVSDLEWDVKTYFALAAATHDAACACWGAKRYYEAPRPITMIRYLASQGQSSDSGKPGYNPYGIPLQDDVCEVITVTTSAPGGKHESIWDIDISGYVPGSEHIGEIVVFSWPSEPGDRTTQTNTVRWMFGEDWVPYQRANFNTPAFPGYISGHSTFSRSAAEVLTAITGNAYVPGGLGTFVANANTYLVFERGPTQTTTIQWATWYDAADLAGQSRRWGGIHPAEDDYPARIIGSKAGKQAWALAQKFFNGSVLTEQAGPPSRTIGPGSITITQPTRRGLYYRLESSTNLSTWTSVTPATLATNSNLTFTDPTPFSSAAPRFYRVVWDTSVP